MEDTDDRPAVRRTPLGVERVAPLGARQKRQHSVYESKIRQEGAETHAVSMDRVPQQERSKAGQVLSYDARRRAVELYDEGASIRKVSQECGCCYKLARKLKLDIVNQALPMDANGKHIGAPVPGRRGGYRRSRLNGEQQALVAQLAVEHPRWKIAQMREEIMQRYKDDPSFSVSDATIWRVLRRSKLQYMRALLKDPRREGTLAHRMENEDFAREQLKGADGVFDVQRLFFMDETIVYLNEVQNYAWAFEGGRGATIEKSKGKTQTIAVYAGVGLIPKRMTMEEWGTKTKQKLFEQSGITTTLGAIELPRGNHMQRSETGTWEWADEPPRFALMWWIRPPQRTESRLGRFITMEDVTDPNFQLTLATNTKPTFFTPSEDLKNLKKFVQLWPYQLCENATDVAGLKVVKENEGTVSVTIRDVEHIVEKVPDEEETPASSPLTADSVIRVKAKQEGGINTKDLKLRNTTIWGNEDLKSMLYFNNVEYREVDEAGELVRTPSTQGRDDYTTISEKRMRERFAGLQGLLARTFMLADKIPEARTCFPLRYGIEIPVPRMYFGVFGRRTRGGALDSVHGDKAMFMQYLEHLVGNEGYFVKAFAKQNEEVRSSLVLAWDAASSHGNVEVTSDSMSWIHKTVQKLYGLRGCVFLPVRQPDFNPVELLFSFVKSAIRRRTASVVGQMTVVSMVEIIDAAFGEVTEAMIRGWIQYGCYIVPGVEMSDACKIRFDMLPPDEAALREDQREALRELHKTLSNADINLLLGDEQAMVKGICHFTTVPELESFVSAPNDQKEVRDHNGRLVRVGDSVIQISGTTGVWQSVDSPYSFIEADDENEMDQKRVIDGKEYKLVRTLSYKSTFTVQSKDGYRCTVSNVKDAFLKVVPLLDKVRDKEHVRVRMALWSVQHRHPAMDPVVGVAQSLVDELYSPDRTWGRLKRALTLAIGVAQSVRGYAPETPTVDESIEICLRATGEQDLMSQGEEVKNLLQETIYNQSVERLDSTRDWCGLAIVALVAYKKELERVRVLERSILRELGKAAADDSLARRLQTRLDTYLRKTSASGSSAAQVPMRESGEVTYPGAPDAFNMNAVQLPPLIDVAAMRNREALQKTRADKRIDRALKAGKDVPRRWPGYPLPEPSDKKVTGKSIDFREKIDEITIDDNKQLVCTFEKAFPDDIYDGVRFRFSERAPHKITILFDGETNDGVTFQWSDDETASAQGTTTNEGVMYVDGNRLTLNATTGPSVYIQNPKKRKCIYDLKNEDWMMSPLFHPTMGYNNRQRAQLVVERWRQNELKMAKTKMATTATREELCRVKDGIVLYRQSTMAPSIEDSSRLEFEPDFNDPGGSKARPPPKKSFNEVITRAEQGKRWCLQLRKKLVVTEADFAIYATVAEFKNTYGIKVAPHSMRNTIRERVVQKIKGADYGNLHYVEAGVLLPANLREWNVAESLYVTSDNLGYYMSSKRSAGYFPVVTLSMLQTAQNDSKGTAKDFSQIKLDLKLDQTIIDNVRRYDRQRSA